MRPLPATSSRSASRRSSFALAPVAGSKLQICFSRSTSSKTCWIVDRVAHRREPERRPRPRPADRSRAAAGVSSSSASRNSLGRQVGEHLVLGPPQHVVADRAAHAAAASSPARGSRGPGTRRCPPGRRRCSRPACRSGPNCAAAAMARTTSLVVLGAVLDPLRFVEHHQVEMHAGRPSSAGRVSSTSRSRQQQFVVGDPHAARRAVATARPAGPGRPRSPAPGLPAPRRSNSRCQLVTSGLGQTSSTLRTSPRRSSRRMAVIACMVFPRPISSARIAACRG